MAKPSVLVLYNQPLLPNDHPDAQSEHTVVEIAEFISRTLDRAGFSTSMLGLGPDPGALWQELKGRGIDVVFNLFEGNLDNPETESYVAGLLDWAGMPYTGSPFQALSLARAKHTAKYLLKGAGLPTADFQIVHELPAPVCKLDFPVIVKPATQDASIGMDQNSVCTDQCQLEQRVQYVFLTYGAPVLIEEYIPGRELNVSLLELPELEALPPLEIVFPEEDASRTDLKSVPPKWPIFTYGAKWKTGTPEYDDTNSRFPTDLSPASLRKLNRLATKAYRLLGCRDYARVDFRMTPSGKAYILEVNPNPDISEQADLTRCLDSARLSQTDFIVRLVEQASSRRHLPKPTFAPAHPPTLGQASLASFGHEKSHPNTPDS
jgi:D-alanine-D-alanine ligase